MANKKYAFQLCGKSVTVEADCEGNARYMVRLAQEGRGRIRIGYLTGADRRWLVEFFGGRKSEPYTSAKAACKALAEWALTQPGLTA